MNPQNTAPPTGLAVGLALASVYLVWGSTYLAIRVGLDGYPPFLMGSLRFIAAALVFYAFLRWRGHAPPTRAQWKNAAVMGLFMMLLGNGLVNVAEQTVSSGLAAVAVASMPLWAGLFGVMRGQHPSRGEWTGLVIGFLGVVWLNFDGEMRASLVGMVALLLAPIAWAWGSVWSRGRDLPAPFMSTAAQMLCGGVAMGGLGLLIGERITEVPPLKATTPELAKPMPPGVEVPARNSPRPEMNPVFRLEMGLVYSTVPPDNSILPLLVNPLVSMTR